MDDIRLFRKRFFLNFIGLAVGIGMWYWGAAKYESWTSKVEGWTRRNPEVVKVVEQVKKAGEGELTTLLKEHGVEEFPPENSEGLWGIGLILGGGLTLLFAIVVEVIVGVKWFRAMKELETSGSS